jgi:hypothetical protein
MGATLPHPITVSMTWQMPAPLSPEEPEFCSMPIQEESDFESCTGVPGVWA